MLMLSNILMVLGIILFVIALFLSLPFMAPTIIQEKNPAVTTTKSINDFAFITIYFLSSIGAIVIAIGIKILWT